VTIQRKPKEYNVITNGLQTDQQRSSLTVV